MDLISLNRNLFGPDSNSEIFSEDGSKLILDNIYGSIRIYRDILKLVHTPEFQRLHYIRQLGFCYMVFPGGVHSRFIHSIGVSYLAFILCMTIKKKYPEKLYEIKELGITTELTDQIILYIVIAALMHDISHGPFSHTFDDVALKNCKHPNASHEVRSILIMSEICKRELNYNQNQINFIASLINPSPHHTGVLYQIVSNNLNELDVDKFDYLRRDPTNVGLDFKFSTGRILQEFIIDKNNNICYDKRCSQDVLSCFTIRYNLHSIVYSHKTVKIIECMYSDILQLIDPIFKISECILDMKKFIKYTDEKIFRDLDDAMEKINLNEHKYTEFEVKSIIAAHKIYTNILTRKLYKSIFYSNKVNHEKTIKFIKTLNLPENTFEILSIKIGFISDKKPDPFKSIYFYDNKNEDTFTLDKTYISGILNGNYSETKILLICKNIEIAPEIKQKWKKFDKEN
jgi:HD superfamily phosphohydrolase